MRVIIAIWSAGRVECYSTLTVFLEYYPGRNYETIQYHLSRNERPYSDAEVTLYRVPVTRAAGGLKTKTLKKSTQTKKGKTVSVDMDKVIVKPPLMIYEHKSKPEPQ
jgi:hypothetical protein